MKIRSHNDLIGLSIAQARAAYAAISDMCDEVEMDPRTGLSWKTLYERASNELEALRTKIANETPASTVPAGTNVVTEPKKGPETHSLRRVWTDLMRHKDVRQRDGEPDTKWYARRQRQLDRLKELNLAAKNSCGFWVERGDKPSKDLV